MTTSKDCRGTVGLHTTPSVTTGRTLRTFYVRYVVLQCRIIIIITTINVFIAWLRFVAFVVCKVINDSKIASEKNKKASIR